MCVWWSSQFLFLGFYFAGKFCPRQINEKIDKVLSFKHSTKLWIHVSSLQKKRSSYAFKQISFKLTSVVNISLQEANLRFTHWWKALCKNTISELLILIIIAISTAPYLLRKDNSPSPYVGNIDQPYLSSSKPNTHTETHTDRHTYRHRHTHTHSDTHITCTHTHDIHTYTCTHKHVHKHIQGGWGEVLNIKNNIGVWFVGWAEQCGFEMHSELGLC